VLGSESAFYQIPLGCRPKDKYLVYLYTNGLQVHLSFLLDKRKPKTLSLKLTKWPWKLRRVSLLTKTDAMDTLSTMKLVSHKNFVEDTQERGEQVLDQQK
jgi:hypothetical protein